jgi:hydroxylamine reductase
MIISRAALHHFSMQSHRMRLFSTSNVVVPLTNLIAVSSSPPQPQPSPSSSTRKIASTLTKNNLGTMKGNSHHNSPFRYPVQQQQQQQQQQHRLYSSTKHSPLATDMFCRQCEQTSNHTACVSVGVCGKTNETSAVQDALVSIIKNVSHYVVAASANPNSISVVNDANKWTLQAAFSTLTNVNFSTERIVEFCTQGEELKKELQKYVTDDSNIPKILDLSNASIEQVEEYGYTVSIPQRATITNNEDAFSLNEIATYGLKGTCAYAMHCYQLLAPFGKTNALDNIMKDIQQMWSLLDNNTNVDIDNLFQSVLKVGEINASVMALLDQCHVDSFGVPEPTQIPVTVSEGKCILVSGHDLQDLYELLKQTEGTGINVYTHGEMMPAHTYPKLRQFKHLVANYGTAWQNQRFEFASFPGPIIVTTNCIVEPRRNYKNRLYTMNEVGVDNVHHIGPDRDFTNVIKDALKDKGFPRTIEPPKYHLAGFNHRVITPIIDQIIDAAKSGSLSRIFLIGGCDGTQWDRNYFTDLANETPSDSMILTLGCAKNRLIRSKSLAGALIGNTGLPRVVDVGQCNDSYSAVVVALELAKALQVESVNDLPLSLAISHLEQKATAVLCTLLHLGVKNIRLGPSLPAYISPNVLDILNKKFNLLPTGDSKKDLQLMMDGR